MNASRPDNLPPSQGGKYQGFGSTPAPDMSSSSASYGLTSRDAPSLSDFQDNPVAALGKGWSLFSSVVASATRTVNEAVIQPSVERVLDPEFQASVKGYASEATKKAAQVGSVANEFVLSWCPSLRLIILMPPSGGGRPPWVLMLLAKLPVSLVSLVARWGGAAAPTPAMARSLNSTTLRTTIPRTMTKTKTTFSTTSSHRAVTSIPVQAQ
jgi:hypothetical protein